MDWTQVWTVLGVTAGLFLTSIGAMISLFVWNRTESRADIRHMDNQISAIRELVREMHIESKDFHARLIAIEERNKK